MTTSSSTLNLLREAEVPIKIVCPAWCETPPQEHALDLWENGGHCFHRMPARVVVDPTGIERPLEEPQKCDPIELWLITSTRDDGHEAESPIVYIETAGEHTIDQALALADAIRDMVKQYRAAGGVA